MESIDIFGEDEDTVVVTTIGDIRKAYEVGHTDGIWYDHDDRLHTDRPLTISGEIISRKRLVKEQ